MGDSDAADKAEVLAGHQAYLAALRLLARRDHSVAELTFKLQQREHEEQAIQLALDDLLADNHVNDERYAQYYAEHCVNRGHGPLSIRSRLEARGIDGVLAAATLKHLQVDWSELAELALSRRFSVSQITDTGQRSTARIARFLQGRGFSSADTLRALKRLRRQHAGPDSL